MAVAVVVVVVVVRVLGVKVVIGGGREQRDGSGEIEGDGEIEWGIKHATSVWAGKGHSRLNEEFKRRLA